MDNKNHNLNITISSSTIIKTIIVLLIFAIIFLIRDIVLVVFTAIVAASAIEPLTVWFGKNHVKRLPAVIVTYLALAIFVSGAFYFFVPLVINDTSDFLNNISRYMDSSTLWNPLQQKISEPNGAAKVLTEGLASGNKITEGVAPGFSLSDFFNNLSGAISNVSDGAIKLASLVFGGVLSLILIIVLSFYFAVQKDGIADFLKVIIPIQYEEYILDLWARVRLKIGFWMQGQMFLGLLVGAIVYPLLLVFGVKHALFLAILAAVFEVIPLFGPIMAAIPAIVIAFAEGGISKALLITGMYVVVQQFENHLFYPLVVKKIVGVPPILVILALIIGGKLAGFLGLVLSVPMAVILMEFFNDLQNRKLARQVK